MAVERDLAPDRGQVAAVLAPPECFAQHGPGGAAGGTVILFGENSADSRGHTQHAKITAADVDSRDWTRVPAVARLKRAFAHASTPVKGA